ncbi:hypothetical protein F503_00095 [Ophiostoma piceae UAMH 11346]|uniref:Uncharacterized protein n=1 Tax=Ophiostoma piceae (strain UAMH 11346) TaxID=1262450 RepID=S3BZQ7_OPHP1|nr:hypothetical protein F503_00095 [Ophiostoma piceae UAMH 11346]
MRFPACQTVFDENGTTLSPKESDASQSKREGKTLLLRKQIGNSTAWIPHKHRMDTLVGTAETAWRQCKMDVRYQDDAGIGGCNHTRQKIIGDTDDGERRRSAVLHLCMPLAVKVHWNSALHAYQSKSKSHSTRCKLRESWCRLAFAVAKLVGTRASRVSTTVYQYGVECGLTVETPTGINTEQERRVYLVTERNMPLCTLEGNAQSITPCRSRIHDKSAVSFWHYRQASRQEGGFRPVSKHVLVVFGSEALPRRAAVHSGVCARNGCAARKSSHNDS